MSDTFRNLIGGEWVGAKSGATFENRNPADTSELVGLFAKSDRDDTKDAIAAAKAAQPKWAAVPAPKRGEILYRAANILESRADQVAREMTREEGKTLPEARGEVGRAVNILRFFGGEGARLGGQHAPSERERVFIQTRRRPLGVIGLITPWNFPIAIPAWKTCPALIAGNAVVLEAVGSRAALRAAARRSAGRSRRDERRAQPCHGPRLEGRRRDRREPRGARDLVHGIGGHRQRDCRRGGEAARARSARNGRQEPDDRPGRRRHPRRRQRRRERRVLLDGAALHRDLSRHRRRGDSRAVHRGAGRADACAQGRQRTRGGHRDRPVDRRQAAGHGARLRRHRRRRRREGARQAARDSPTARTPAATSRRRPSWPTFHPRCAWRRRRSSGRCWR